MSRSNHASHLQPKSRRTSSIASWAAAACMIQTDDACGGCPAVAIMSTASPRGARGDDVNDDDIPLQRCTDQLTALAVGLLLAVKAVGHILTVVVRQGVVIAARRYALVGRAKQHRRHHACSDQGIGVGT